MTTDVKARQVWQSKALGSRWVTEIREGGNPRWWTLTHETDGKTKSVPDWILVDDYILVKDAP